ncbi:hypothetical protein BN1048_01906 [Jeotgalicoccus saudimassiliensis]|uniref:Uncharacterized protein n=1 Tax=Jeotgalicoccus saudimassiliensis TaxID=1461582 RepID=A0A078M9L6_9STAP|nr:hypothetical protein BN1048_01906 [Jeotgalicoccus saudimassiliensis]
MHLAKYTRDTGSVWCTSRNTRGIPGTFGAPREIHEVYRERLVHLAKYTKDTGSVWCTSQKRRGIPGTFGVPREIHEGHRQRLVHLAKTTRYTGNVWCTSQKRRGTPAALGAPREIHKGHRIKNRPHSSKGIRAVFNILNLVRKFRYADVRHFKCVQHVIELFFCQHFVL